MRGRGMEILGKKLGFWERRVEFGGEKSGFGEGNGILGEKIECGGENSGF